MVFPLVMYGCNSGTIKKAESRIIDAFKFWCWRTLENPLGCKVISNQSILKEINPEYSLEGLILKLKLQYFSHLMERSVSLEKTMMLGKTEGKRRRGWQRMRWLDNITNSMDMNMRKFHKIVKDREGWYNVHGVASWIWLTDWTITIVINNSYNNNNS